MFSASSKCILQISTNIYSLPTVHLFPFLILQKRQTYLLTWPTLKKPKTGLTGRCHATARSDFPLSKTSVVKQTLWVVHTPCTLSSIFSMAFMLSSYLKIKKFLQTFSPWSILSTCKVTVQQRCSYLWRPSARERSRTNVVGEDNRNRPQGRVVEQVDEDEYYKCSTSAGLHTYGLWSSEVAEEDGLGSEIQ
jgi:hypothetical protein